MKEKDERLNEATALLDVAIKVIDRHRRMLSRVMADYEQAMETMGELVDEYDRLMSNWEDEVEIGR